MSDRDGSGHAAEARERWGDTEAYAESTRRTKSYTDADWKRIRDEQADIEQAFAEAMAAGKPSGSERATALAEEARLHIDRHFYPCSREMHAGLADLYTADERFRAHYEDRAEGLAEYVAEAIKANLDRGSA